MTPSASPVFLDTNILVYANVAEAPHHADALAAIRQLRTAGHALWISRQVLREYAATLTRRQLFSDPRPAATVVERIRYFEAHLWVADETALVTERLLALLGRVSVGGKQIHDANIVATMQVHGIRHLLTVNTADFVRFAEQIVLLSLDEILSQNS